ncbi:sulfite exporter TauE/SafE family protein [bacterium]|nr:MAG: sulfite exporter TauE/SafE family protein [bacterium]
MVFGLDPLAVVAVLAAGLAAGAANTVVGSGSLLTFPTLLAVGYSPVVANISNTVGLVFGSFSGVTGQRPELAGQRHRATSLAVPAVGGGLLGAILLLALPQTVFHRVVPVLILFAVVLVIVQPRLAKYLAQHQDHESHSWSLRIGVFLTAVYGGYFGAAQGVIFIAVLAIFINDGLQRLNAVKNVLAVLVNGVAAIVFVLVAHVAWIAAALIAVSSVVGGQLGAVAARRLDPKVLRAIIVVAGLAAVVKLVI